MHSQSHNIEIIISDDADEVIKELFDSLKNRYHSNLESIKGNDLALIMYIYCIINVIKQIRIMVDRILIFLIG